jgi:type III secretion system low calcium response chaperone LcrH/SycD
MSNQTRELIEKAFEGSQSNFSPKERQQLKENFSKMVDEDITLKKAFGLSDKIIETFYNHAYNLYKAGKYRDAAVIFELLRKLSFNDPRYSLAIAACYHYLGEYAAAAANYHICKEIDLFNPIPCFHLYDCLMKMNQPIAAIDALSEVIARSETDPRFQEMREKALLEKNNLMEQTRADLERRLHNKNGQ